MNRKYYFLTALMIVLTVGLLFLPELSSRQERSPEEMLRAINRPGRYLSTDQVAARIIERDPSMLLIDVREPEDYEEYSLYGALNVPLSKLLDKENKVYTKLKSIDVVFYSNGDINAEKAWLTAFREGADNVFIMQGGLNRWMETILRPQKPAATAPAEDMELYDFRRAACLYFKGGVVEMDDAPMPAQAPAIKPVKKPVVVKPHPQEAEVEGGC